MCVEARGWQQGWNLAESHFQWTTNRMVQIGQRVESNEGSVRSEEEMKQRNFDWIDLLTDRLSLKPFFKISSLFALSIVF